MCMMGKCTLNNICQVSYHSIIMDVLGRKANLRSGIWNYFGLKLDGDGKPINEGRPASGKCKMSVSVKRSNTSNMFHHL